jgi:hypothetical protein
MPRLMMIQRGLEHCCHCRRSTALDGILRAQSFVRLLFILFMVWNLCSPCTGGRNSVTSVVKVFLNSEYSEKDEIKALGARWDNERKKWFVPPGRRLAAFSKWIPVVTDSQSSTESEEEQTSQSSGHERHRAGLGALQVDSTRYVQPSEADRSKDYECIECGKKVILKRGEIRVPHFAHHYNTSGIAGRVCGYYEHPGESEYHNDSKHKLAELLRKRGNIKIRWKCSYDGCSRGLCGINTAKRQALGDTGSTKFGTTKVKYEVGDTVRIEYRDPGGQYVADVALLNGNTVRYIFEVKHSHSTTTTDRPEPWFEITTKCLLDLQFKQGHSIHLKCVRETPNRNRICQVCNMFYVNPPDWIRKIPRLVRKVGVEGNWEQTLPCVHCGRARYNPVFLTLPKGFRQICKICLSAWTCEVQGRYERFGTYSAGHFPNGTFSNTKKPGYFPTPKVTSSHPRAKGEICNAESRPPSLLASPITYPMAKYTPSSPQTPPYKALSAKSRPPSFLVSPITYPMATYTPSSPQTLPHKALFAKSRPPSFLDRPATYPMATYTPSSTQTPPHKALFPSTSPDPSSLEPNHNLSVHEGSTLIM